MEWKVSYFLAEKRKIDFFYRNENKQRFPAKQMRKQKFYLANVDFFVL
jgi:hypothetical protein